MEQTTILCLASYFKGAVFLEECHRRNCRVVLLTLPDLIDKPWPQTVDEIFPVSGFEAREELLRGVAYLARTRQFAGVVPLDEYVVEMAGEIRERLRIPGMSLSRSRHFRDKLLMRIAAREAGVNAPDFSNVYNDNQLGLFFKTTKGPWILKPRAEAGSVKMKKGHDPQDLWPVVERLGDDRSHYLIESFVEGDVLHVDSIVWDGQVLFAAAHQYWTPPFQVWNQGGIFATRTVPRKAGFRKNLLELNKSVITALGLKRGVTHGEFIRGRDGTLYFLELAARVGGAHIDALVRGTTGLDLWQEWARIEVAAARKETYTLPKSFARPGGLMVCLSRQESPDLSVFSDPEVAWTYAQEYHAGLVLAGDRDDRIEALLVDYQRRIEEDILAVAPPTDKPA